MAEGFGVKTYEPSSSNQNAILWVTWLARICGLHYVPSESECRDFLEWHRRNKVEARVPEGQRRELYEEYFLLKQECQNLAVYHFETATPVPGMDEIARQSVGKPKPRSRKELLV